MNNKYTYTLEEIEMTTLSLGEKIALLRTRKKLSKKQLAEMTDMHWTSISKYERNEAEPYLDGLRKLANALEVTTDYLLLDKDAPLINDKDLLSLTEKIDHLPDTEKMKAKTIMTTFVGG